MYRLLISLFAIMASFSALAQNLHPQVLLNSIEMVKEVETYGDELYLVVTEFSSDGSNVQYTIPHYPVTWPSEGIHELKNVKVWERELKPDSEEEVIVELVEHDAPPFNVDDSLGSIRIKMKNNNGLLETEWLQDWDEKDLDKKAKKVVLKKSIEENYTFDGEGGEYKLKFTLKNNAQATDG